MDGIETQIGFSGDLSARTGLEMHGIIIWQTTLHCMEGMERGFRGNDCLLPYSIPLSQGRHK